MKFVIPLLILLMSRLLGVTMTPTGDAVVQSGAPDTNFGSTSELTLKSSIGYMRFNLAELGSAPAESAALGLTVTVNNEGSGSQSPIGFMVEVWGLREDLDNWTENSITWSNSPSSVGTTLNSSAVLLGNFKIVAAGQSTVSFTSPELSNFLNSDRDHQITLMLRRTTAGAPNLAFASKEHATPDSHPTLTITPKPQGPLMITEVVQSNELVSCQFEFKNFLKKSGSNPAIYASDDLINWVPLDTPVYAENGSLSGKIEVGPTASSLYFKVEENPFKSLSPHELDIEASHISGAIEGLGEIAIELWNNNPALSTESSGEEALTPLLAFIKQLMATFTPEERKSFLEISRSVGLGDDLREMLAESSFSNLTKPGIGRSERADTRWNKIEYVRRMKKKHAIIKKSTLSLSLLALRAGPIAMAAAKSIGFFSDVYIGLHTVTPTKLTKVKIITEDDLMGITLHEDSFPRLKFEGDFVADSSILAALTNFVTGLVTNKAIDTAVKVQTKLPLSTNEIKTETAKIFSAEVFKNVTEDITKANLNTNQPTFLNVPFPDNYFTLNTYCYAGLEDRPSLVWNPELGTLDAEIGGEGIMDFTFVDTLYSKFVDASLEFKVTDLPPQIVVKGPAVFDPSSRELRIPLIIEDERKEKLLLKIESSQGPVPWKDGVMTYRVPNLSLSGGGEQKVTSEAITSATITAQFPYLDDKITIRYSDQFNSEKVDSFQIDLRPLIGGIKLEIGSPPAGMMQSYEVLDVNHPTSHGLAKKINMKLSDGYNRGGVSINLNAQLGAISASGKMTLKAEGTFYYPPENFLGTWLMTWDGTPFATIDVFPDGKAYYTDKINYPGHFWRWSINQSSATIDFDHSYYNIPLVFYIPRTPEIQNEMPGKGRLIAPKTATLSR